MCENFEKILTKQFSGSNENRLEDFKRRFRRSGSLGIPFVPEEDVRELFSEKVIRHARFLEKLSHGMHEIEIVLQLKAQLEVQVEHMTTLLA